MASGFQWYAVQVDVPHVGNTISYIYASSAQQAGENFPGSTVIGGPYPTQAAAEKAWPQGATTSSGPTVPSKTGPPTTSDTPVTAGLGQIGDFFARLTEASTWIRLAEVVIGLGLIVVGLAKLAAGTPVGHVAAKAAESAALL